MIVGGLGIGDPFDDDEDDHDRIAAKEDWMDQYGWPDIMDKTQ